MPGSTAQQPRVPSAGDGPPPLTTVSRPPRPGGPAPSERRDLYLGLRLKLLLVVGIALAWAGLSLWIAIPWVDSLAGSVGLPLALAAILGIAIVPGYLNANLVSSLLIDRPPPLRFDVDFPAVTVVIACYQEEETIEETIDYVTRQEYPGELRVLVADDGSTDRTVSLAMACARRDPRIKVRTFGHSGKAGTLTRALLCVETPLVATVDADTLLMPGALKRIVARLQISPADTVAVAGAVFVRNSRQNVITRAQEWDYFLGIASVKRQQGLFQGTMVAQGAFSVYRTEAVRGAGGWPDRIGEDIVLTWAMMREGGRVGYERTAIAFTGAPVSPRHLARQRRRWARGMIEGLREHGSALLAGGRSNAHAVLVNFLFPFVDLVYSIAFPVGIVLALSGNFAIVGPMTFAVLPLNVALSAIMFTFSRRAFAEVGLKVRQNRFGFVLYLFTYQLFMSPVSVAGYVEEFARARRNW